LEICFDFIESARPWLGVSTIDLSETRAEECEADASVGHASDLFRRIHPLCRQLVLSRATQVRTEISKRKKMKVRSPGSAMLKRGAAEACCRSFVHHSKIADSTSESGQKGDRQPYSRDFRSCTSSGQWFRGFVTVSGAVFMSTQPSRANSGQVEP
jgi:hypothetical protein